MGQKKKGRFNITASHHKSKYKEIGRQRQQTGKSDREGRKYEENRKEDRARDIRQ
jgi:hypothetical protein